ncbi:hypothetical protein HOY82DRAFT_581193 [Tuber indicum]|nr:hypothetical protein HOY82DRAFT_581193 [Tuber indicum]
MLPNRRTLSFPPLFFSSEEEKRSAEGKQMSPRTPPHRLPRSRIFFNAFFLSILFLFESSFPPDLSVPVNDATDEHQAFRWFLFPAAHFARLGERRFSSFVLGV